MLQFLLSTAGVKKHVARHVRFYHQKTIRGKVIGIRREDQSVWERRAPLAPTNVRRLTRAGVKVIVQPSNRRAYPMQSYASAGALIQEDLSEASVIFGVKQVPIDQLLPNKTYCLFSHTIKAQESNMPLLDAILEKNIRLIDYEKLIDESGQRVVAFGKYAGVAGMVNILHGVGLRLLAQGHHTPFMHIGPAHNYRNSSMARQAIRDAGYEIALGMMPQSIGPLIFVFTGSGNVSRGGQEVFQELPHEYVPPEMLEKVARQGATTKVYGCEIRRRHHLERKDGAGFDPVEYDQHPEKYISTFSKKIAPYASVIINGIYWAVDSPKLLTIPDAKYLLRPTNSPWIQSSAGAPALPHRILAICDISADPGGSIEFMNECTTIDTPFCLYDAERNKDTKSFKGPGVLVCSIDNMPTQLPRESTDFFGDLLYPFTFDILQSNAKVPLEEHNFSPAVHGAIIASNGHLTKNFEYIAELREQNSRSRHKTPDYDFKPKRITILGAGYVSAPVVEYLLRRKGVDITLASMLKDEADLVAAKYSQVKPVLLNVMDSPETMRELISSSDIVVSLLPHYLHHHVAESCIDCRVNMVTASYCTEEMKKLHQRAVDSGITIVNEVGLDPGIDHLLAMECFDEIHQAGGKVESFVSYCGGLPAPEFSENPLRYKFSWNPRSVLSNIMGTARYTLNGKIVEIPEGGALMEEVKDIDFLPGFSLEGFPNRDSNKYTELYGIREAHTVLRGTLRYRGFSDTMQGMLLLGLLDQKPHPALHPKGPELNWRQLISNLLGLGDSNVFYDNLKTTMAERIGGSGTHRVDALESLGLLDEVPVHKLGTPLDTLTYFLSKRLSFGAKERDLIILRHDLSIKWPNGKSEKRSVNMVLYGNSGGHSAMSRAVGIPTAIATNMVLDGEIQAHGMILPFSPDIYRPLLSRLKAEGIEAMEESTIV